MVDTFDAMTTSRSYRRSISYEEAIDLITQSSGSQFDPEIIDVFTQIPKDDWIRARDLTESDQVDYLKNLIFNLTSL